MTRLLWVCDSCGEGDEREPWDCPGCGKEVCENCFDWYAHCRSCSRDADPKDLIKRANDAGWDFDDDEWEWSAATSSLPSPSPVDPPKSSP